MCVTDVSLTERGANCIWRCSGGRSVSRPRQGQCLPNKNRSEWRSIRTSQTSLSRLFTSRVLAPYIVLCNTVRHSSYPLIYSHMHRERSPIQSSGRQVGQAQYLVFSIGALETAFTFDNLPQIQRETFAKSYTEVYIGIDLIS